MKRLITRLLLLISSGALLWQVVILAWFLLQKGDPTTPITVQVRSGSYGVIDGNGVDLVAADWFYLSRFGKNGRATGKKNKSDTFCSVINAQGEVLGSFEADSCETFGVRNVAAFFKHGKCGLINSTGQVLIPADIYDAMYTITGKTFLPSGKNVGKTEYIKFLSGGLYALYDDQGKKILSPEWNRIEVDKDSGLIFAIKHDPAHPYLGRDLKEIFRDKPFVFNSHVKMILESSFVRARLRPSPIGLITIDENGRSFINLDGKLVLRNYLNIRYESGLLLITTNKESPRTGLADTKGNILVPMQYGPEFYPLFSGSNMLMIGQSIEDDLFYAFRPSGEKLEGSGWTFVTSYEPTSDRFAGAFKKPGSEEHGGFQVRNGMGEKIFECDYEHLESWNPNGTVVATDKNSVRYLLDRMGRVLDDSTNPFSENPEHPANSCLKFEKMPEGKQSRGEAGWWDRLGRKIDLKALSDESIRRLFSKANISTLAEFEILLSRLCKRPMKLQWGRKTSTGLAVQIDGKFGLMTSNFHMAIEPSYHKFDVADQYDNVEYLYKDAPSLLMGEDSLGQFKLLSSTGQVICDWGPYFNNPIRFNDLFFLHNAEETVVLRYDRNRMQYESFRKLREDIGLTTLNESESHILLRHFGQDKWRQSLASLLTKILPLAQRSSLADWANEKQETSEIWNNEGMKIWENTRMSIRDRLLWRILPLALAAAFFYGRLRKSRSKNRNPSSPATSAMA